MILENKTTEILDFNRLRKLHPSKIVHTQYVYDREWESANCKCDRA